MIDVGSTAMQGALGEQELRDRQEPASRRPLGGALVGVLPLLSALAIGGAVRLELARTAPPFLVANDSADYFSAGYNLLTNGELQLSLKRTPLYSLFLAGLIDLVGPSLD